MNSEELPKETSEANSYGAQPSIKKESSTLESLKHSAGFQVDHNAESNSKSPALSMDAEKHMASSPTEATSPVPDSSCGMTDDDPSRRTQVNYHEVAKVSPCTGRNDSSSPQPASRQDPSKHTQVQLQEKQRGKRLLGLLNNTLAQPRDFRKRLRTQAPRSSPNPLAQEAPAADLEAERAAHNAERAAIRSDLERVRQISEQLAACETAYRTARSQKRRLSSYLVTHVASKRTTRQPAEPIEAAVTSLGRGSDVPVVVEGAKACDVYYLPRKLLPSQEDTLDAQEEAADDAIDRADDEYDQQRAKMERELFECKSRLQQQHIDPNTWPRRKAW